MKKLAFALLFATGIGVTSMPAQTITSNGTTKVIPLAVFNPTNPWPNMPQARDPKAYVMVDVEETDPAVDRFTLVLSFREYAGGPIIKQTQTIDRVRSKFTNGTSAIFWLGPASPLYVVEHLKVDATYTARSVDVNLAN